MPVNLKITVSWQGTEFHNGRLGKLEHHHQMRILSWNIVGRHLSLDVRSDPRFVAERHPDPSPVPPVRVSHLHPSPNGENWPAPDGTHSSHFTRFFFTFKQT